MHGDKRSAAAYLWSPLSGGNPIKHCDGIFVQFQDGVAFGDLVLYLNLRRQTLKHNMKRISPV